MTLPVTRFRRFLPGVATCLLVALITDHLIAQDLTLDYSYLPPRWNTPIGLPGDWHKPMVNEDGALVYDFGPGPYAIPGTAIGFGHSGDTLTMRSQTIVDPRVPLVRSELAGNANRAVVEALSVVPHHDWQNDDAAYDGDVRRLNGLNGMIAWANPPGQVDPAFRNVAYGTNRPIIYRIRLEPGVEEKVVLGFADPYREQDHWIKRVMVASVEGAESQVIDVVDRVGQNMPVVLQFDAADSDGDGWLDVRIDAQRETIDGNLFVNVIWVFPAGTDLDDEALIRGDLSSSAEHYIDCGRDPQILARTPRTDLIRARFDDPASGNPVLEVRTKRDLEFDSETGVVRMFGSPFIVTQPAAISAEKTEDGWVLTLPEGTAEPIAAVLHGVSGDATPIPDFDAKLSRLSEFWRNESRLPWDKITVSDREIQNLFDGSIRTMYQLTERVDGLLQSQPGPSVYRGLWVSNQPRVGRALTHLGDYETARSSFKQSFRHQREDGQVVVLTPPILLKESGTAVTAVYHHARLSRDREFLESYWPELTRVGEWIAKMRSLTTDPNALNYRLMPAGFSDGGIGGIVPEYTSVSWNMLAVKNLADGADWLGKHEEAARYAAELADFQAAFRKAAARDIRQDDHGNWFLPIRMEHDPDKEVPQRSQTQFAYMVYPGRLYEKDDPIVVGNMQMLADAPMEEGLVLTTGWLDGGLQPFIEATRAGVRVYRGEIAMAQEAMYAIGNHAAPTHVWIEEQLPGTGPRRTTGDVPHSSGCSEWINMVRYFLAIEDGDHLHLLKGVPEQWIYPGARIAVDDIPTEFGQLTFELVVSDDGRSATIRVEPVEGEATEGGPLIHLGALRAAGFTQSGGAALPDVWGGSWGEAMTVEAVAR